MAATTAGLTWGATGCDQHRLASQASPAKRPNLVFVFSDQQSQDMLGCYGSQLNNLYGDASAADLQQKMEQLTQEWMARFNDPGLGSDVIDPMYQYENGQWPQDTQEPGFQA